jgi:transcription elongation factor GreA
LFLGALFLVRIIRLIRSLAAGLGTEDLERTKHQGRRTKDVDCIESKPQKLWLARALVSRAETGDGARHLWWLCAAPCYSLISTMKDRILKRFNDEIAVLERELKVDLPKEIQRARELGDLRENAEYKAAKERQDIVNARIAMLKRRAGEIALMNLDRIPRDRAGFGSTVELRASTGENVVYQLVMPEEADVEKGLISTSSPIGRAILNKEEGDEINVSTPSGTRNFELLKLTTIHDD